jgi:DNA helicase-2/ATP-dependent DNA helicase PcrA
MEWDTVYLLNVVDGSFPSEFSTGKAELIEEERRLLYVAMTRAQNDLIMIAPLKFHITNQPKRADGHVYGGRSRFMTEKVLKCFDAIAFQGSNLAEGTLTDGAQSTFDVGARVKDMW